MKLKRIEPKHPGTIQTEMVTEKPAPLSRPPDAPRTKVWYDPYNGWGVEKYVTSPQDWSPSYDDGKVKIGFRRVVWFKNGDVLRRCWIIVARGQDDTGFEHIYQDDQFEAAAEMYNLITDGITMQDLKNFGFVHI